MLINHFKKHILWYVIALCMIAAGATWFHFNTQISEIDVQIKNHAVDR